MFRADGPAICSFAAPTGPRRSPRRRPARGARAHPHPERVLLAIAFSIPLGVAALGLPAWLGAPGPATPMRDAASLRPVRSGAQPDESRPSVLDPTPPPTLVAPVRTPAVAETPPTATSAPARHTYAIRAGDELRFIAARNGVSLASLVALNGIPDPDRVAVGQELAIPAAGASSVVGRTISALVTGYANGADGGAVGSTTASGTRTHWGTVAADLRAYPFGTKLVIDGFDGVVFVVEDTGSGVHGDIFDVWFPDVPSAVHFGAQRRQVTILPPGG